MELKINNRNLSDTFAALEEQARLENGKRIDEIRKLINEELGRFRSAPLSTINDPHTPLRAELLGEAHGLKDSDLEESALSYHSDQRPGKLQVSPTKPMSNQRDLSLAYSPGVAFPCMRICNSGRSVAFRAMSKPGSKYT